MDGSRRASPGVSIARIRALAAACLLGGAVPRLAAASPTKASLEARPDVARPGDYVTYEPRPILPAELKACSFRHALCVHGPRDRGSRSAPAAAEVLALLDAADRAWDVATGALELPSPALALTYDDALDLYLVDGEPFATRTLLATRDPRSAFDRASAFGLVGRGVVPGCALDQAAARVVARAILFAVAPATDEGSAIAESASTARLMVACAAPHAVETDLFQAHPELGIADTLASPGETIAVRPARLTRTPGEVYAAGASLFYDWLDDRYGAYPGAIVRAVWALSPTKTPLDAARWNDEPDGYEVLRASFKNALSTGSTVDDLWLDFAVGRAFVPLYPARIEWTIAWPTTTRGLTGAPLAPTGSATIAIDCAARTKGARLRVEARWEEHARMLWTVVRVAADGHELGRVGVPGPARGTEAQLTIVDLDGAARVLVIGTNAGDPLYPFDPDDRVWEPHGWTLALASEAPE